MVLPMTATRMATVAAVLAAALASTAAAAPATPAPLAQARARAAAAAGDVVLYGVSCAAVARCVAVGQETTTSNLGSDFAQAWNGRRWRVLAPPSPGSPAGLSGVACTGPAACIAVGSYPGPAGPGHTLAIAWNGQRWRVLATPSPGNSELTAIACPRPARCVAVGDRFTSGGRRTLAEAWNGTSWRVLPAADTHSADAKLDSISCAGPERCMATGTSFNPATGATITLAESWNGGRWQLLRTQSPGTRVSDLASVSCASPARCVAVGFYLNSGQPFAQALAETWNGIRWRILPPLATGRGGSLLAVSCTGLAQCIAIGAQVTAGNGGPLAEAWNGTRWHVLPTASLGTAHGNLLALSCPRPGHCAAAGDYFGTAGITRPLTEEWNGSRWRLT
jgi:uncharacterized membrane protein